MASNRTKNIANSEITDSPSFIRIPNPAFEDLQPETTNPPLSVSSLLPEETPLFSESITNVYDLPKEKEEMYSSSDDDEISEMKPRDGDNKVSEMKPCNDNDNLTTSSVWNFLTSHPNRNNSDKTKVKKKRKSNEFQSNQPKKCNDITKCLTILNKLGIQYESQCDSCKFCSIIITQKIISTDLNGVCSYIHLLKNCDKCDYYENKI